jgi:hypothetical protein
LANGTTRTTDLWAAKHSQKRDVLIIDTQTTAPRAGSSNRTWAAPAGYTAAGQLACKTSSLGKDIRYTYDSRNVTRDEHVGSSLTTDCPYDASGNRLTEKQTYASLVIPPPTMYRTTH